MSIESPLFNSAMELIAHSISHYNGKKELDRKLVILHLANAVELILKDLLVNLDVSIYKNPKETISIQGCLSELEKKSCKIEHINKIELLIDERNALQHRFGSPNELTAIYYMKIAEEFFTYILKEHYSENFYEVISQFTDEKELSLYTLSDQGKDIELDKIKKISKEHPLGACLSAWSYFEKIINKFSLEVGITDNKKSIFTNMYTTNIFEAVGVELPKELENKIKKSKKIRNMAAHGRLEPTVEHVNNILSIIEEVEKLINNIDIEQAKEKINGLREDFKPINKEIHGLNVDLSIEDKEGEKLVNHIDMAKLLENRQFAQVVSELMNEPEFEKEISDMMSPKNKI